MTEHLEINERIRQKAHDLFMQFGLRSVSMDDIANNLGISKKTIYHHYSDKDELVNEVVGKLISHNQSICDWDRKEAQNAVHEIFLAMDLVSEMFRSMNPSLMFDMQKYYPAAYQKFARHKNDYLYGVIRENLLRGIREELYRPEIRVDVLARFRVESIIIPFNPEFHTKVKENLADMEEEITLHYLFGLVSLKGYKAIIKYQQERLKKLTADAKKQ